MPIYEFYCGDCHRIFSFFSKTVNTTRQPPCPKCHRLKLERQVSAFAAIRRRPGGEGGEEKGDLPIDEAKMERAVEALAGEAENINEDDPRQAARLMRKFSNMTGLQFGDGMEQALHRMEAGEDPETIENEMGDLLNGEGEEPFVKPGDKAGKPPSVSRTARPPSRDGTLYDL